MTRVSRTVRRLAFVTTATLSLAGMTLAPPVFAATEGTVTQASPAFVANTGSATSIAFTLSSAPTSPGALLDVTLSGPAATTVTQTGDPAVSGSTVTATFDLRGKAPGAYAVTVADASGGNVDEYTCAACLRLLATPPTVTSVAPAVRAASSPATTFTVTGTNLFHGASVAFLRAGSPDATIAYPSTGTLTVSGDQRTVSGPLAIAAGAVPGPRDVVVTNTDGQSATCAGCLTVNAAPSFASLSPAVAGQGAVARVLALAGGDFADAMTAAFYVPGSTTDLGGVVVTSFAVTGPGSATITMNVADRGDTANVQPDLVLTNPDGGTTRVPNALTVTPEPVVTSLSPATLDGGAEGEPLAVTGTGLASEPSFTFSGSGVTVNGYQPGVLDVSVAAGAATGGRTVTVVNPDGGRSTSATVLTVGATPAVTSVSPASLGRGAANRAVTITGSGFDTGGVALTIPGVTLSDVVATSATTITAKASVPGTADVGVRDVSVLNTAAGRRGRATCAGCFAVDTFAVDSVTPSAVLNSARYTLDVAGSGLPAGKAVTVTLSRRVARAGQDPITFDGVVDGDGTHVTGTADLRAAAPGPYTVRVADGEAVGTCGCVFTVVAETTPALTSVTPSSLPQGATAKLLTLKGSGFTRGADVRFGTGVTKAGLVTFVDTTTLTVPVDVAGDAPAAAVAVTVVIPSSGADTEATCGTCLTVTKRPAVTATNRPTRGQGAPAVSVTLTGTDFQPGATVEAGDGVTVTGVVRASATSISYTAAVAADAVPGPRTVTVTNPDGGAGTCSCLTVTPRPLTTALSPATGGHGRTGVSVVLTGSGFQGGAVVSFGHDVGVSVTAVTSESITVSLDLRESSLGAHPVSVTNQDGGSATCACEFTVHVVPTVTGVSPASRGAGAVEEAVTITGTNFTPAATVAFADPGITVVRRTVVDPNRIDAVVSIAGDVTPGGRSVTVTNADTGQAGSCACFAVNAAPTLGTSSHTAQRNRQNVTLTLSGAGFQPGPVRALLGDGITVDDAQATSPTSVTVTFDVAPDASLGARDVAIANPDGGRATCASCLSITTPRAFTIETSATPRSGAAQTVTVTAHVASEPASAVDTSYTGTPVLTAAGDGHFAPGSCTAATNGVSTCGNVVFGDLGATALNVAGTGADSDVGGTKAVVVQPVGMEFVSPPRPTAKKGVPAWFGVRPVAGVSGATIDDYDADRTAHVTGGSAPTVPLDCDDAVCVFTLTFDTVGRKTVRVSDTSTPSVSTPTVTVVVPEPTHVSGFRVSPTRLVAGQAVTVSGTLLDSANKPVAGQTVRIYTAAPGSSPWSAWLTDATDGSGRFTRTARMTRSRQVRAVFVPPSGSLHGGTASNAVSVRVAVRVTVSSPGDGSRVAANRTFHVRGATWPGKPGTRANLVWRRPDGRYVSLNTGVIGRDGRFAIAKSLRRGTYTLQVWVGAAGGNAAGRSAFFTVRVT